MVSLSFSLFMAECACVRGWVGAYMGGVRFYGAYNMTKLFEFELCKFELLTSVI